jgi:hypothetical protein
VQIIRNPISKFSILLYPTLFHHGESIQIQRAGVVDTSHWAHCALMGWAGRIHCLSRSCPMPHLPSPAGLWQALLCQNQHQSSTGQRQPESRRRDPAQPKLPSESLAFPASPSPFDALNARARRTQEPGSESTEWTSPGATLKFLRTDNQNSVKASPIQG